MYVKLARTGKKKILIYEYRSLVQSSRLRARVPISGTKTVRNIWIWSAVGCLLFRTQSSGHDESSYQTIQNLLVSAVLSS